MAVPDVKIAPGIIAFAKGPLEMRERIRHLVGLGEDNIKLNVSGEQICETRDARLLLYWARKSVRMCVRHGVDIISHASWIDNEGMEMLDKNKHMVALGLNWLIAALHDAAAVGHSHERAEQAGYEEELDAAIPALEEMHGRSITVLLGGDHGFACRVHGNEGEGRVMWRGLWVL